MTKSNSKELARKAVAKLVGSFRRNETDLVRASYNETQARTEFITPLLEAFGWDVHNHKEYSLALREVIEEATVEVGDERLSKKPDYELRLARQRKLFVEAKKPSVRLDRDKGPAFQTRRYGFSASLPISVVTNFRELAVYDCRIAPKDTDDAVVARLLLLKYEELETRFDELWPLLSRDAVYSGEFDRQFAVGTTRQGAEQFDDRFLSQVRDWRKRLAIDIRANSPTLNAGELTYAVQLFLSRIVFLRICEDREIEKYETLKTLDSPGTFAALMEVLRRADEFYDSGLFRLLDDERLRIRISDSTLKEIIAELYYPYSPYNFAVVETKVLGEIYEQFLGEVISVVNGKVSIVDKPEVRESGGVVSTPAFIADAIVERTIGPAIAKLGPSELASFSVADICCGSGTLLLSAYEYLLDHYLTWYLTHNRSKHVGQRIYEASAGQWRLSFEEKRRILLTHVRGVDIDPNAVEVTQFSLLLKLIENERAVTLKDFVNHLHERALPALDASIRTGNSLVSEDEWRAAGGTMTPQLREKVSPIAWETEFPTETASGGFNVIVGNPPYVRIQNMVAYSPDEAAYYGNPKSPYATARQDNFDKYGLFIERSLSLVKDDGRVGVIVPNKFMTLHGGKALRHALTTTHAIEEIVNFGAKQVFGPATSNYTCILIMDRSGSRSVRVEKAGPLEAWRYGQLGVVTKLRSADLSDNPWEFADDDARLLFDRVRASSAQSLSSVAEIFVGVQTSADKIFIIHAESVNAKKVVCRWNGKDWPIERGVVRPCLHDVQLFAYSRPTANSWMIFPYDVEKNTTGVTRARLLKPKEFATRFPGAFAYLSARRSELKKRNIVGGSPSERQWYQYGRSQSLTKFDTPKIILPILSVEARYSYDEDNTIVTGGGNGPYYMVRALDGAGVSNKYLLAILNHPFSEALVRTKTSIFRGGYYSHGKQFIENLPVPIPDPVSLKSIEGLVDALLKAVADVSAARTPRVRVLKERAVAAVRAEIDAKVNKLFGLSSSDRTVVREVRVDS
jgi:hypothetical protein